MITWWAFSKDEQPLLPLDTVIETEHIYARNRYAHEKSLSDESLVESLGNKVIIEKRINIRASDYRFEDKKRYYRGYEGTRGKKEGSKVAELLNMADCYEDFGEEEIKARYENIVNAFINYLRNNDLLQ